MVLYQCTCNKNLSKIQVLYQLLLHCVQDLITLNIYCEEIFHALKTLEKLAVSCREVRSGFKNQVVTSVFPSNKRETC